MDEPILETKKLTKNFGMVCTARELDLSFRAGVLTSIIGPNGAGKSTLINMLSGSLSPDSGRIFFQDRDVTDLPIFKRVRRGLCRSFQVVNVFPELTVFENVQIPVLAANGRSGGFFRPLGRETGVRDEVMELLEVVSLTPERNTPANALSHGDQRLLEVGIALASRPRLLFLDEPTAGMNPVERVTILENVRRLSNQGKTTFIIVEHDMDIVFSLSDRVVVLHRGDVIGDGTPEEIKRNEQVREVYLGEEVMA